MIPGISYNDLLKDVKKMREMLGIVQIYYHNNYDIGNYIGDIERLIDKTDYCENLNDEY